MPMGSRNSWSRISPGWMGGSLRFMAASVVVHDFYVFGVRAIPAKADAELIVDPDAVLALAIALQGFQPISRRHSQVFQAPGPIELLQFAPSDHGDAVEAPHGLAFEEVPGVLAAERLDRHWRNLTPRVNNVKRT